MKYRSFLPGLALLVFREPAYAEKRDPAMDLPYAVGLQEFGSASISLMSVKCDRTGARTAACWFSQAWFKPPDLAKVKANVTEARALSISEWRKILADVCKNPSGVSYNSMFVQRVTDACTRKSPEALRDAQIWFYEEVASKSCKLDIGPPYSMEFTQLDADTWQWIGQGSCSTTIGTLYRPAGDILWDYKQVRSVRANSESPLCKPLQEKSVTWSWKPKPPRSAQCTYVDY